MQHAYITPPQTREKNVHKQAQNETSTSIRLLKGTLKTRDWKTRDWKTRDQNAGVENAGLENAGPPNGAGKRRTGKRETT